MDKIELMISGALLACVLLAFIQYVLQFSHLLSPIMQALGLAN